MAHWGLGPLENEAAAAWFDPMRAVVLGAFDALADDGHGDDDDTTVYEHARAAAYLVASASAAFSPDHLLKAIEALEHLRAADEWLGQWDDGPRRAIVKALDADLAKLDEIYRRRRSKALRHRGS